MRLFAAALLTGLAVALATFAGPAAATPRAEFSFTPAEPRAGEPVSFFTSGAGCDARPCTYWWTEIAADGTATVLGSGRSLVVRFPAPGTTSVELTVTNRGFRAPPGPQSASVTRAVTVGPPLDGAGPETTITSGPEEVSATPDATFEFTAEEGATFECRLDAGEWAPCTSPASVTGLPDGDHQFAVRATDAAGNVELAEDVYVWTIDTAGPGGGTDPPFTFPDGVECHFGWVTFCEAVPPAAEPAPEPEPAPAS